MSNEVVGDGRDQPLRSLSFDLTASDSSTGRLPSPTASSDNLGNGFDSGSSNEEFPATVTSRTLSGTIDQSTAAALPSPQSSPSRSKALSPGGAAGIGVGCAV